MKHAAEDMGQTGIPNQEIHVWRVPLSQPQDLVDRLEHLLDPEERERAARFHFAKDRIRYTIAHGALRTILGEYLKLPPDLLCFRRGRFGKPYLSVPAEGAAAEPKENRAAGRRELGEASPALSPPGLQFNLSHSRDFAVIAVSSLRRVGVDVDTIHAVGELDSIVNRYFSAEEKRFLSSTGSREHLRTLLTLWCRREAAAKALGLDLSAALSAVKVPVYPTGGSVPSRRLAELQTDRGDKYPDWFIRDLRLDDGHVGAVCHEGRKIPVAYRDFTG
jgi:4'-phosphopantetheinyl transferase